MKPDQSGPTSPPSIFGERLRTLQAGVTKLAEQLRPLLNAAEAWELDKSLDGLQDLQCRVAVLGQVKAGKSSLVNALVRRQGLCPTNINPWTAVVCQLKFGGRIDPEARAIFTFFDEADWSYLGSGGRMRELTHRLGLSVDQDLLQIHLDNTRERAERRLGSEFQELLGQQHRFAEPSGELLASYISVGADGDDDEDEEGQKEKRTAGRFSDITKSAELFFDLQPFSYPTTIIDTPGTNDPLLVRDDLTRSVVDGADVHIVVLTADQALSSDDISLLRMLQGLHKERLVVFINRIDILHDINDNLPLVVDHVRDQLARDFPETNIPVIAGSAHWADLALGHKDGVISEGLPTELVDWAKHRNLPLTPKEKEGADTVIAAAGISALEEALRDVVREGPSTLALIRAFDQVCSLHDEAHSRLQNERTTLEQASELAVSKRAESMQHELEQVTLLRAKLEEIEEPFRQDVNIITEATTGRMKSALEDVVATFADDETDNLCAAHEKRWVGRIWRCDTRPLRRLLEQTFLTTYDVSIGELLDVEGEAWQRLENMLKQALPGQKIKLRGRPPYMVDPSPSITSLGATVALDLGEQWERWWHRWQTMARRARRFRELVHAEFSTIVTGLVEAAEKELGERGDIGMQHFERTKQEVLKLLNERRERLQQLTKNLANADKSGTAAIVDEYRIRTEAVTAKIKQCDEMAAEIRAFAMLDESEWGEPADPVQQSVAV